MEEASNCDISRSVIQSVRDSQADYEVQLAQMELEVWRSRRGRSGTPSSIQLSPQKPTQDGILREDHEEVLKKLTEQYEAVVRQERARSKDLVNAQVRQVEWEYNEKYQKKVLELDARYRDKIKEEGRKGEDLRRKLEELEKRLKAAEEEAWRKGEDVKEEVRRRADVEEEARRKVELVEREEGKRREGLELRVKELQVENEEFRKENRKLLNRVNEYQKKIQEVTYDSRTLREEQAQTERNRLETHGELKALTSRLQREEEAKMDKEAQIGKLYTELLQNEKRRRDLENYISELEGYLQEYKERQPQQRALEVLLEEEKFKYQKLHKKYLKAVQRKPRINKEMEEELCRTYMQRIRMVEKRNNELKDEILSGTYATNYRIPEQSKLDVLISEQQEALQKIKQEQVSMKYETQSIQQRILEDIEQRLKGMLPSLTDRDI